MDLSMFPNFKNEQEARTALKNDFFIINSLLDNDFYKFTMQQFAFHNHPDKKVKYRFKCRTDKNLLHLKDEITHQIKHYCTLKFKSCELDYLRSKPEFQDDYVDFLKTLQHDFSSIHIFEEDGDLMIEADDLWTHSILMEVPFLAIINGVETVIEASKGKGIHYHINEGIQRLYKKIDKIKKSGSLMQLVEFGVRRRFLNYEYQKCLNEIMFKALPKNYLGASNVLLGKDLGIQVFGTMAHEYLQANQAISTPENSQRYAFEKWLDEYKGKLAVALSDIFGNEAFFVDFGKDLALKYTGLRHDSGCPFKWGEQVIRFYEYHGIDPKTKTIIFSDSLDIDKCIDLATQFGDRINVLFGVGTHLTNDVDLKALSIVFKMTHFNGLSVAKISNNRAKIMSQDENYLARLFKMIDDKLAANSELLNFINNVEV